MKHADSTYYAIVGERKKEEGFMQSFTFICSNSKVLKGEICVT
jgi:hypothetical protein